MNNLHEVDLNLWVVFAELLDTRSVTEAARRLKRSQSAVSHSLATLRQVFGDLLFIRVGSRFEPTPRALALGEPVRATIREALRSLTPTIDFDPARLQRVFRLSLSDYAQLVLMGRVLAQAAREAPGVSFDVTFQSDLSPHAKLANGELDLAVAAATLPGGGVVRQQLFTDRNVLVLRAGHPALKRLTVERYAALPHLLVSARATARDFVDDALWTHRLRRRVVCRVPHFASAPHIVAESDAVATVPARVAAAWAKSPKVAFVEAPLKLPGFAMAQFFSELYRQSPEHAWLRKQVARAAQEGTVAAR